VKRFDLLIRAFAASFRGNTEVRLVIGGDGSSRQDLESLGRALGVQGQVRYLGGLSREGVRRAMWEAHCFVLPSLIETFGVVLIEALATGLPVIATRSGGPDDIVVPEVGVLLEPGEEHALAAAMVAIWAGHRYDPHLLRRHAVQRYGYKAVGTQLLRVYQKALAVASSDVKEEQKQ
jgi:glycosyltransferase involved in cell wall biosynthesis